VTEAVADRVVDAVAVTVTLKEIVALADLDADLEAVGVTDFER